MVQSESVKCRGSEMKIKLKKSIKVLLTVVIAVIFLLPVFILVVNDITAINVKNDLKKLQLPEKSQLIDSKWIAGKVVGNGNGMQYFGAILIRSELTWDELDRYYSQYRNADWQYQVAVQKTKYIDILDKGGYSFKLPNGESFDNYYIVYNWGDVNNFFSKWDLRGH